MYCYSIKAMKCPPEIPVCVRDSFQGPTSPMHGHDYMEIAVVRQGCGEHVILNDDGSELRTSVIKGDIFVILNGEHHYFRTCRNFRLYNICVGWEYFDRFRQELLPLQHYAKFFSPDRKPEINMMHLTPVFFQEAETAVKKLQRALYGSYPSQHLAVQIAFLELLLIIFDGKFGNLKNSPSFLNERILNIIADMEANPEQNFSINDAARKSNMSVSSFAHKFKETVGISPVGYGILLRLERSRKMLENTDKSIEEIAIANGFCDGNYLGRLFRKRYGMSPRSHRKIFCGIREDNPILSDFQNAPEA